MISLKKVDLSNIRSILELSVDETQKSFVADNTASILEAYATQASGFTALPFGIYEDETPVGFVMFGYDTLGDEDEPEVAAKNYCIWRFMIDRRFQGRGLGRAALAASLDYLRTMPCGEAAQCWLSYEPENSRARALYQAAGFHENGEICGGEIVAVRDL
ncbi:MAG: GNAT family N-acetyltransferase [Hominenteromicrobium sp.]